MRPPRCYLVRCRCCFHPARRHIEGCQLSRREVVLSNEALPQHPCQLCVRPSVCGPAAPDVAQAEGGDNRQCSDNELDQLQSDALPSEDSNCFLD